jgi:recombination protein RecA
MASHAETQRDPTRQLAALAAVIAALRRRYGEHIIRRGADGATLSWPGLSSPLSTGSLGLDLITDGLPRGQMTEYAGREGAGVETLAATAISTCQRAGGLTLLIDADGAVDPDALLAIGVDLSRLIIAAPTTAREGWAMLASLSRCGALDLLVLASFPGLLALPRDGWRDDTGVSVGYLSRRLSRVAWALRGRPTALLLLNRVVEEPSAALGRSVGEEVIAQTAGLRVALIPARVEHTPDGDIAALHTIVSVLKHHGAPRGPRLPLAITSSGPRREAELVALGQMVGCLETTALGLALDDVVVGRSPDRATATLWREPDLAALLERRIRARWDRWMAPASIGITRRVAR